MSYFGLGVESTRGTPVSPAYYIPVDTPTWNPMPVWLEDKGMRGSPTELYTEQIGVRHDEYEMKGQAFLDTLPNYLRAILGSTDTVTGAGPYTHVIGQYYSVANGSQPPSYTLVDFDAGGAGTTTARQFTAGQLNNLDLTFAAAGSLEVAGKWMMNPAGTVSAPSQSYSSEIFVPAWDCAVTIGGVASNVVEEASIKIDRKVEPVYTLGSQSPYRLWASPLGVTGKIKVIWEPTSGSDPLAGATVLADGVARATLVVQLVFTEPSTGHTCTLHMNQCQLKMPKPDRSKAWYQIEAEFTAEANTTDAVGGGYSPLKSTTVNAISGAY